MHSTKIFVGYSLRTKLKIVTALACIAIGMGLVLFDPNAFWPAALVVTIVGGILLALNVLVDKVGLIEMLEDASSVYTERRRGLFTRSRQEIEEWFVAPLCVAYGTAGMWSWRGYAAIAMLRSGECVVVAADKSPDLCCGYLSNLRIVAEFKADGVTTCV